MPRVFGRMYRRVVSLLLTAAVLFSCLPAQAAGMSVTLEPSDPSTAVPVGTTITFEVKGTGTAAVSLMVVPPDSRQKIIPGASHEVTFSQPGMYVIAGYGANGTDENAAGFQRCMSPFHIVQAVGDAPAEEKPTELRGTLTLEAYTKQDPYRVSLRNAELRWNELLMWVNLSDQSIPEGARLQVDLYLNHESRTLLECEVGQDTSWRIEGTEIAKALMAGGSGEPEYGRYAMSAAATIHTPDGQKITSAEPFVMGWYSPEMLYVNQFYNDSWTYAASDMGKRLVKWLDMSERGEGDRSSSGYLMLEQEILHRKSFLIKAGELYVIWAQKALKTVSSLGMNVIMGGVNHIAYEKKFGSAGQKVLPYYNMLASVYNSYAQKLLEDVEQINRGAYLVEQIEQNTTISTVKKYSSYAGKVAEETNTELLYWFAPAREKSSYYMLGNVDKQTGATYNYTLTELEYIPDELGGPGRYQFKIEELANGTISIEMEYFADLALKGDRVIFDTSRINNGQITAEDFFYSMEKSLYTQYPDDAGFKLRDDGTTRVKLTREEIVTYTDIDGKRKFVVDSQVREFDAELVEKTGLADALSPTDRAALEKLNSRSFKWDFGKVMDVASFALDVWQLHNDIEYHSDLQKAYFNTYKEISNEYICMLDNWCKELEGSDAKDAEYILAAVNALKEDVYRSCTDTLSEAAQNSNVFLQTVDQRTGLIYDFAKFVCEIPAVQSWVSTYTAPVKAKAAQAVKSAVTWASNATGIGKNAVAGAASAGTKTASAAAGRTASNAFSTGWGMLVITAGSIIYDLLFGAKIGTIEAFYDVYYTKQTLKETLDETLRDYAWTPTHQQAVDIIESLYLMKELKLKGENLVISYYLTDMYKQFGLDGVKEQLILMNEIVAMDSNYELNGAPNITQVYVLHENYIAGTRKDLKDQGRQIDGAGFIIGGDNEQILGTRIVGVYCNPGETATYQGVELEPVPAGLKAVASKDSNRDSASHPYVSNEADWLKEEASLAPDWQNDMPATLENSNMYVKIMYLYSNHGLDLLLTDEERKKYGTGEGEVNRILHDNNDATGDELAFWQIKEKAEWQAQQRIVWTYVTRKYIESLPMFDRAQ